MNERLRWVWVAGLVAYAACGGDSGAPEGSPDDASTPAEVERPATWDDATHGERAEPDYTQVFSESEVHRIDIEISPENSQAMLDDIDALFGQSGNPIGGGGNPMMGAGGFMLPAELTEACNGKKANDACTVQAAAGSCTELPGALLCVAAGSGFPGGGMPPGGGFPGGGMPPGGDMAPADGFPGGGAIDLLGGRDPIYVPVTLRYDGRVWTQVGMRYKGNSSLAGSWGAGRLKLGFRLQFDEFEDEHPEIDNQRFFGFRELTFSSGWSDDALLRDALASDLLRSEGLPAARWAFYRVYVDAGEGPVYWGLYTMLEDPSDVLPETQFEGGEGNVYKPDGQGADFTTFSEAGFVKKNNEKAADYSDVMRAIDALHASRVDPAAWRTELEQTFDVSSFLHTLAVSRAIGHWDSYGRMAHNYYLYGDPTQAGRLHWISWDHNLTWQGGAAAGGGGPGFGSDLSPMMDEVTDRWPLIRYLLDDEVYRAQYRAALAKVLEGGYAPERFEARANELHSLIAPYVLGEQGNDPEAAPYTQLASGDAFRTAISDPSRGLLAIAEQRRQALRDALAKE